MRERLGGKTPPLRPYTRPAPGDEPQRRPGGAGGAGGDGGAAAARGRSGGLAPHEEGDEAWGPEPGQQQRLIAGGGQSVGSLSLSEVG
jgi:hypothetical protein